MAAEIKFALPLTEKDWEDGLGGWRCSAASIPGANLSIVVQGIAQDPDRLRVDRGLRIIRWLGASEQRPTIEKKGERPSVVAVIELKRRLAPISVPIIVALIGLVGTILSALLTILLAPSQSAKPLESTNKSWTITGTLATDPPTTIDYAKGDFVWIPSDVRADVKTNGSFTILLPIPPDKSLEDFIERIIYTCNEGKAELLPKNEMEKYKAHDPSSQLVSDTHSSRDYRMRLTRIHSDEDIPMELSQGAYIRIIEKCTEEQQTFLASMYKRSEVQKYVRVGSPTNDQKQKLFEILDAFGF